PCVQPNNSSKRSASGNSRARRGRVGLAFGLLVGWSVIGCMGDIRFFSEIGSLGRNRISGSQSDRWGKLCETVPISCHPQASFPATLERYPIAHGWDLQQNDTCIAVQARFYSTQRLSNKDVVVTGKWLARKPSPGQHNMLSERCGGG